MKLAIFVFLTFTAFADSAGTFEVKEIDQELVSRLTIADAKLDAATRALAEAQVAAESARTERDAIAGNVKTNVGGAFEGTCVTGQPYAGANTVANYPMRSFRRVEIRGKYALITSGAESCWPGYGMLVNGSNMTFQQ